MGNNTHIRTFAQSLAEALVGDVSGWTPVYMTDGGLHRYVLRDDNERIYDAYVYGGLVHVYDPNMRRVTA